MRAKVAAQLQEGSEAESNEIAESRALKTVIESSTYEIPKSLIENMANDFYEESVKDMRTRRIPASQIQEHEEQLRADAHAEAINAIKSWTTLNEVVDVEGIEVTDEDFEKEAAALSRRTGVSAEAVAKVMDEDEHRNRYERRIMHVKVLQAVMSHATITDKEVSREEFERAEAD
jgi:trigger factor